MFPQLLTLRMRRTAATPEVAITLALLGTRLRRIGMVASAAWSNRLPSTEDRWLESRAEQGEHQSSSHLCFVATYWVGKCRVSPQSDAGLSHHLRAEVLGGQFKRRLQEPQLLQKPVELCCAGQEQRAHLLQLEGEERRRRTDQQGRSCRTGPRDREVRTSYSSHSELPVPLIIWQHVSDLRQGLLHLPVGVDLVQDRRKDRWEELFLPCMEAENVINRLHTCTVGTSSKAWMKPSSSTAPAPEPVFPADTREDGRQCPPLIHTYTLHHTHTPINQPVSHCCDGKHQCYVTSWWRNFFLTVILIGGESNGKYRSK